MAAALSGCHVTSSQRAPSARAHLPRPNWTISETQSLAEPTRWRHLGARGGAKLLVGVAL